MTCPHCGYCPSCGRSGHYGSPFHPWLVPYQQPYPYWGPTWGGAAPLTSGSYGGANYGNYQQGGGQINAAGGSGSLCNHLPQGEIQ